MDLKTLWPTIVLAIYAALLTIFGFLLIFFGVFGYKKFVKLTEVLQDKWDYISFEVMICVIGSIIMAVGLFGFCCALRTDAYLIIGFQAMLVIIFIGALVVACFCFWYKDTGDSEDLAVLLKWVYQYDKGIASPTATFKLFVIQDELQCCGYHGVNDFNDLDKEKFPRSCCKPGPSCDKSSDDVHTKGCKEALNDATDTYTNRIGAITIVVAILAVLGMILILILMHPLHEVFHHRRHPASIRDKSPESMKSGSKQSVDT